MLELLRVSVPRIWNRSRTVCQNLSPLIRSVETADVKVEAYRVTNGQSSVNVQSEVSRIPLAGLAHISHSVSYNKLFLSSNYETSVRLQGGGTYSTEVVLASS